MTQYARVSSVIDLSFGDTGKGAHVDHLCRTDGGTVVVRFNGGSQAGHNVITPNGAHHMFNQYGSGSFVEGVKTYLSQYMLVNLYRLHQETKRLIIAKAEDRNNHTADHIAHLYETIQNSIYIHENAVCVTAYQEAANRLRERARQIAGTPHGSCGMGIGETAQDVLDGMDVFRVKDLLRSHQEIADRLEYIGEIKRNQLAMVLPIVKDDPASKLDLDILLNGQGIDRLNRFYADFPSIYPNIVDNRWIAETLRDPSEHVVFEGAQGVLLDQHYGFHPHTTWSRCNFDNISRILVGTEISSHIDPTKYGLIRAYTTRHGAGPMPTATPGWGDKLWLDDHNQQNPWQGRMRFGPLDVVLIKYAIRSCFRAKPNYLVMSCLDELVGMPRDEIKVCIGYQHFLGSGESLVTALPVLREDAVAAREGVTRDLMNAVPAYVKFPCKGAYFDECDFLSYCEFVEELLGIPIAIYGTGPTSNDRHHRLYDIAT